MILAPVLLSLCAAAALGMTVQLQRMGLDHADARAGTTISILSFAALFWLLAPFWIDWSWWSHPATLIFAGCGLVFPALSQRLQIYSVVKLGPAISSSVGVFAPLFAALPAVVLLGERFNLQAALGLAIMIGGVSLATRAPKGSVRAFPLWAILIPIGASFFRGIVQPVVKIGLLDLPSPFFATMVMATVSAVLVTIWQLAAPSTGARFTFRRGQLWFVVNGALTGIGILLLNKALQIGEVVIAAPFLSTVPLWALFFGWTVFRREPLTQRHLLVAGVVVFGAALLVTR